MNREKIQLIAVLGFLTAFLSTTSFANNPEIEPNYSVRVELTECQSGSTGFPSVKARQTFSVSDLLGQRRVPLVAKPAEGVEDILFANITVVPFDETYMVFVLAEAKDKEGNLIAANTLRSTMGASVASPVKAHMCESDFNEGKKQIVITFEPAR